MIPNLPRNRKEMTAKFLEYVSPTHHVIRFYYLVLLREKSPEAIHLFLYCWLLVLVLQRKLTSR